MNHIVAAAFDNLQAAQNHVRSLSDKGLRHFSVFYVDATTLDSIEHPIGESLTSLSAADSFERDGALASDQGPIQTAVLAGQVVAVIQSATEAGKIAALLGQHCLLRY